MKPYKVLESWAVEEHPKVKECDILTYKIYDYEVILSNSTTSIDNNINDLIKSKIGKEFLKELYKDYFTNIFMNG